jgi:hypothetical protein
MKEGFYEQIITQSLQKQLSALQDELWFEPGLMRLGNVCGC